MNSRINERFIKLFFSSNDILCTKKQYHIRRRTTYFVPIVYWSQYCIPFNYLSTEKSHEVRCFRTTQKFSEQYAIVQHFLEPINKTQETQRINCICLDIIATKNQVEHWRIQRAVDERFLVVFLIRKYFLNCYGLEIRMITQKETRQSWFVNLLPIVFFHAREQLLQDVVKQRFTSTNI